MGDLEFGQDGALFISSGDGANFNVPDAGGDPLCAALFGDEQDIGAFRAQRLDCLAGKILRVDPATGQGLPDNPFFTGDPDAARSKVWASGFRNPFRMTRRPGTNDLVVADVGWTQREELDVCSGGENFGWPCVEGFQAPPIYPGLVPASDGCDTLETPNNPGPVTDPIVQWHHSNASQSVPPGITGQCAIIGTFYESTSFPAPYQGAVFIADHIQSWIRVLTLTPEGGLDEIVNFATLAERPVDIAVDPTTGDVLVLSWLSGKLSRIRYTAFDLDGNGTVDGADLGILLGVWGQSDVPADLDGNGTVDGGDLGILLANWG
ncbi:MAG: PQQ-dependent sugar dehydrogenase [Acidimicrobiales bacterium]|nr:PQQ-dependent sugar dehydrogenase [Acidimicrobiales bacterium]